MGKKQHQKDKMYITCTEWSTLYGGKKKETVEKAKFRRLPFSCCSISMQPFEHPLCTKEGVIFDLMNVVPFVKKYGKNPVTGEKIVAKDLIKLNFHKNGAGKYHCPVTFRVFNENTHIVAVKTSGNVFSFEAVERLNIKPGFWKDLITDEPFIRKDLITIQDPANLDKFNIAEFYHLKKNLTLIDEEERKESKKKLKSVSAETKDILSELEREYKPKVLQDAVKKRKADTINAAHYSTGMVAAGFTSTVMTPMTTHEAAVIDEDVLRYDRVKKKAYLQMVTNKGPLNFELHSDMVPKTCENFLKLCKTGYYNDTVFHRSIRNFIIQGGDPTGTGTGGDSIWGGPFKDEFKPNLTHSGRGVLSMANSGPNTNKSQFFITFRSCNHLDNKHTVFGKVVGGLTTLDKLEKVDTDRKTDKPKEEMMVLSCQIYVDPYEEADTQLAQEREELEQQKKAEEKAKSNIIRRKEVSQPKIFKSGIGKYINPSASKTSTADSQPAKKKVKPGNFGNFDGW